MRASFGVCLCLAVTLAVTYAQRGNFRQFNNNNNNNNQNFRPNNNNNNFNNNQNFRPANNNNNFRQFNNNNNNFQPQQRQQNAQPQQQPQQQRQFDFGLDTSDGRFAKFNGPVKGLPHGHGGGRYGAADCLLCPQGF